MKGTVGIKNILPSSYNRKLRYIVLYNGQNAEPKFVRSPYNELNLFSSSEASVGLNSRSLLSDVPRPHLPLVLSIHWKEGKFCGVINLFNKNI